MVPVPRWQCRFLPCNPITPVMEPEDDGFDVVHATAFPYTRPILFGLDLARRLQVPFVLTPFLHLGDPADPRDRTRRQYLARPLRWLLKSADAILVQTELEREAAIGVGLAADRVRRIGLGVAVDECAGGNRTRGRTRWNLPDDAVVIGHLANQSREKGTIDLLQACRVLWRSGKRFLVLLAGPQMTNFRTFWSRFPCQEHVVQAGVLSDAEKRDFYAAIDIFALPSRSDSFGLVFLEAWANSVPCVAYRAGGVAEVIHHGDDGLLARCGSTEELARHLQALVDDQPLRHRLAAIGHQRVLRDHQWSPKLDQVVNVYRELVERHQKTGAVQVSKE